MSITDELREYVNQTPVPKSRVLMEARERFNAIADRIDTEHERAMADAYLSGTPTDEKLTELGWIRLPKDADGEYIHIGDVMEWVPYDDTCPTVVRKVVAVGTDVFFAWSVEKQGYAQYEACAYHHFYTLTVEDVLLEACKAYHGLMIEGISDFAHDMPAPSEIIAKYAAKLRLAEKRETYE